MLPTFLDPVFEQTAHVIKPVFGREGDGITIRVAGGWRTRQERSLLPARPVVYQQYVDMPQITVTTTVSESRTSAS